MELSLTRLRFYFLVALLFMKVLVLFSYVSIQKSTDQKKIKVKLENLTPQIKDYCLLILILEIESFNLQF